MVHERVNLDVKNYVRFKYIIYTNKKNLKSMNIIQPNMGLVQTWTSLDIKILYYN